MRERDCWHSKGVALSSGRAPSSAEIAVIATPERLGDARSRPKRNSRRKSGKYGAEGGAGETGGQPGRREGTASAGGRRPVAAEPRGVAGPTEGRRTCGGGLGVVERFEAVREAEA